MSDYYVGLDPAGHGNDSTGLVVVEKITRRPPVSALEHAFNPNPNPPAEGTRFVVRHVARIKEPSFLEQAEVIRETLKKIRGPKYISPYGGEPYYQATCKVFIDATGLGAPFVDLLRNASVQATPVTLTGGQSVSSDGRGGERVPKTDLIEATQVALQTGNLKIAAGMALGPELLNELKGYRMRLTSQGNTQFGNDVGPSDWREADHDDLVIALALGIWGASERRPSRDAVLMANGF
jgi:hypothetical protein